MVSELFGTPERLRTNVSFYEIQIKAEVEPESATPMEIMNYITPRGLFEPFEQLLGVDKVGMFQYRFYYTPSPVEDSITKTVPWYDLQFFPEIENPDRFFIGLVSRDSTPEFAIGRAKALYETAFRFIGKKEQELNR